MGKLTEAEKALLEPFAKLLAQFYTAIEERSDEDIAALVSAASRTSTSNCWWATYLAAQEIIQIAADERRRRTALEGSPDET